MQKKCVNPTCSMVGTVIETEIKNCLGCQDELKLNTLEDLFEQFLGFRYDTFSKSPPNHP